MVVATIVMIQKTSSELTKETAKDTIALLINVRSSNLLILLTENDLKYRRAEFCPVFQWNLKNIPTTPYQNLHSIRLDSVQNNEFNKIRARIKGLYYNHEREDGVRDDIQLFLYLNNKCMG